VFKLPGFDRIELDSSCVIVNAGADDTFDQILRVFGQRAFSSRSLLVPAISRCVGAIATDIYCKNHHVDGSFGNYVLQLLLVDVSGA